MPRRSSSRATTGGRTETEKDRRRTSDHRRQTPTPRDAPNPRASRPKAAIPDAQCRDLDHADQRFRLWPYAPLSQAAYHRRSVGFLKPECTVRRIHHAVAKPVQCRHCGNALTWYDYRKLTDEMYICVKFNARRTVAQSRGMILSFGVDPATFNVRFSKKAPITV